MDLYAVAPYPNAEFRNEVEAQQTVTSSMKIKERRLKRLFITWVVVFFASVLFGLLGLLAVTLAGMALLFVLFLPLVFLLLYAPALDCPHCGGRMRKDWAVLESGRSGEFLICRACHIYLFTHRTLR